MRVQSVIVSWPQWIELSLLRHVRFYNALIVKNWQVDRIKEYNFYRMIYNELHPLHWTLVGTSGTTTFYFFTAINNYSDTRIKTKRKSYEL